MPEQEIQRFPIPSEFVYRDVSKACFQSGRIWISTNNGCVCFDTFDSEFKEFISEMHDDRVANDSRFFKVKNDGLLFLFNTSLFSLMNNDEKATVVFDIEKIGLRNTSLYHSLICSSDGRYAWVHGTKKNLWSDQLSFNKSIDSCAFNLSTCSTAQ